MANADCFFFCFFPLVWHLNGIWTAHTFATLYKIWLWCEFAFHTTGLLLNLKYLISACVTKTGDLCSCGQRGNQPNLLLFCHISNSVNNRFCVRIVCLSVCVCVVVFFLLICCSSLYWYVNICWGRDICLVKLLIIRFRWLLVSAHACTCTYCSTYYIYMPQLFNQSKIEYILVLYLQPSPKRMFTPFFLCISFSSPWPKKKKWNKLKKIISSIRFVYGLFGIQCT